MRRLLVFGTGAAIIGILLTTIAFYESYLIVSSLQKELGNSITNQTNLLEDATLEAVFLGVMVALGYGLISKGLDGIRKQELLELELPAEEILTNERAILSQNAARQSGREATRKTPPPSGTASQGTASQMQVNRNAGPSSSTVPEVKSADQSGGQTKTLSEKGQTKSRWQSPSWLRSSEPQAEPAPTIILGPPPSQPAETVEPVESKPKSGENAVRIPQGLQASQGGGEATNMAENKPDEVVWEGGAPPALEGVEVLPESSPSGDNVSTGQPLIVVPPATESVVPEGQETGSVLPKRKRGRPKGSKKVKSVTPENA